MKKRLVLILSAIALMATQVLVGVLPAYALGTTPDDTWMTNGTVYATALSEDGSTLYVGGKFNTLRENPPGTTGRVLRANNLAAFDVATGAVIPAWRPAVTGDGAVVHSLAVQNGRVFVGGNFSALSGEPRQNLAAVDAASGAVDPFAPTVEMVSTAGTAPQVYALLAGGSKLYIGGEFNRVSGKSRGKLAAFDLSTGALDPTWKPKASRNVRDLEFDTDRTSIFIGGSFGSITGSDGTSDTRQSVARVQADTGNLHPWEIPSGTISGPQTAWDLTVTPTRLYGGFGARPNYAAAFRLDNGDVGTQLWRFNTVGNVQTVALSPDGSRLFIGGHFGIGRLTQTVCGNKPLRGLASLNPSNGAILCDWVPTVNPPYPNFDGPWSMTTTSSYLWIGGGFSGFSGVPQSDVARFAY